MPHEVTDREQRILGIIETARSKQKKFRDERVNMAHGAGGKATQGMIEALRNTAHRLAHGPVTAVA